MKKPIFYYNKIKRFQKLKIFLVFHRYSFFYKTSMLPNQSSYKSGFDQICLFQQEEYFKFLLFKRFEKITNQQNIDINSFFLLSVIGRGGYSKVILVKKKDTSKVYAMKVLKKKIIEQKDQFNYLYNERLVLTEIDHPFLIKLHYAFHTERKLYFCLEFCQGGELFNLLANQKRFDEEQAKFYAAQLLVALEYLHSKNIVYRDLKPENVLISCDGYIKITDFGLSQRGITGNEGAFSKCGTPEYFAPEILQCESHGKSVDWWTLGLIIYEMLFGHPAYYENSCRERLYNKIIKEPLPHLTHLNPIIRDLLEKLTIKDPKQRLGNNGAQEIKLHPWFASVDWEKLLQKKLKPPFLPVVKNEIDTGNFAEDFTCETIQSSNESFPLTDLDQQQDLTYKGFTYQSENTQNKNGISFNASQKTQSPEILDEPFQCQSYTHKDSLDIIYLNQ